MAEALRLTSLDTLPAGQSDAQPRSLTLVVPGMHCGGCMRKIEQALIKVPGVATARTSLSAKRVSIAGQTGPVNVEQCILALKAVGFDATPLPDSAAKPLRTIEQDYVRRLGVAGFAAANVMLLSVSVWSGHSGDMPSSLQTLFHWLSAMIAIPAIVYAGQPFFSSARKALAARSVNMDVPISLGVTLATIMSLYQTMRGSEQVYFDAAITLLFFLLAGRALDQSMRARTNSAAQNLLGARAPMTSVICDDGRVERIATNDVKPGMRIVIAAGDSVPVDARLTKGLAEIDESLITGESRARVVAPGDQLYCGTLALTGPLEAEAIAVADNTLLSEIVRLMETAEQGRGLYVRLADRAAKLYAPAVHILGLTTFIGWMLAGYGWEPALTAAIAVLIITCPCALALAVPAVQVVATGRLFRRGIVLKAADGLERLAEIDTIVLDKTGTLTRGEPSVDTTAIADTVLSKAAGLAVQSRHPYARAIVRAAKAKRLDVTAPAGVTEIAGAGLEWQGEGKFRRLGSAHFCGAAQTGDDALSTVWFRDDDATLTAFAMHDALRPDAARVVATLKAAGYQLEILSGDRPDAVGEAARATGIETWLAAQRPDDKIRHIEALKAKGRKVLMVGDGLNDAPALAAGHASLSPASASDISQAAADGVFQGDALSPILEALQVAKTARRRSLENFAIAIGYNLLFVPMAMAGIVTPLIAAIAMSGSSLAVTANALRLSPAKKEKLT